NLAGGTVTVPVAPEAGSWATTRISVALRSAATDFCRVTPDFTRAQYCSSLKSKPMRFCSAFKAVPRSTVPSCSFAGGACGKTSVGHEIDAASADTSRRLAWTDMGRPRERVYLRVSATSHFGSRILRCKTHHGGFLLVSLDVYWLGLISLGII